MTAPLPAGHGRFLGDAHGSYVHVQTGGGEGVWARTCCGYGWSDWYRCEVCGHGGYSHGLYRDPNSAEHLASERRAARTGASIPVREGERVYCWAHRPAAMRQSEMFP